MKFTNLYGLLIFVLILNLFSSCSPFVARTFIKPQYISCSENDTGLVHISGVNYSKIFLADTIIFLTHINGEKLKVKPNQIYAWDDNGFINLYLPKGNHQFYFEKTFRVIDSYYRRDLYYSEFGITSKTLEPRYKNETVHYIREIDLVKRKYTSNNIIQ